MISKIGKLYTLNVAGSFAEYLGRNYVQFRMGDMLVCIDHDAEHAKFYTPKYGIILLRNIFIHLHEEI